MEQNQTSPLLLERLAIFLSEQLHKNRIPFFASIIFGFLAHGFALTNKLVNHDEVSSLFSKGATATSGRWALEIMDFIFPNISMPWIYGILTIVIIAISICFIIHIFCIGNKLLQVLLAGCIMVFPSLIGTLTYMFTATSFALSFLLAVLAVWFLQRNPKKGIIPALVCMVFSLSIYQSYIALAASMLVLILIQRLLHGDKIQSIIQTGIFYVAFLTVSLGAYYIIMQAVLHVLGIELNSYAEGNVNFSLAAIPTDICDAYFSFLLYFLRSSQGLIPTMFSQILHITGIIASFGALIFWGNKQKGRKIDRFLLIGALILILPLAINCMYLFTSANAIHTMVLYSFISVYILAIIIVDICISMPLHNQRQKILKRLFLEIVTICLAAVIINNTYTANAAFLHLYLRYENSYAFFSSLTTEIKMIPEYTKITKFALIGSYPEPHFYKEHFRHATRISGVSGFLPDNYSYDSFLRYYLDFPLNIATEEEISSILSTPKFSQMPSYPEYGYMQMFGDVLVVKLSE